MPASKLDSLLAALHLASPALPVGGFAYSQGLEQAVEDRWVTSAAQAFTWISDVMLLSLARQELPLWRGVYQFFHIQRGSGNIEGFNNGTGRRTSMIFSGSGQSICCSLFDVP